MLRLNRQNFRRKFYNCLGRTMDKRKKQRGKISSDIARQVESKSRLSRIMLNLSDWRWIPITVFRTAPRNSTEKSLAAKIEFTRNLLRRRAAEGLHPDAPAGTEPRARCTYGEEESGRKNRKRRQEKDCDSNFRSKSHNRSIYFSAIRSSVLFESCFIPFDFVSHAHRIRLEERDQRLCVDLTVIPLLRPDRQVNPRPLLPQSYSFVIAIAAGRMKKI